MKFEGKYTQIASDCISECPRTQIVVKTKVEGVGGNVIAAQANVKEIGTERNGVDLSVRGKVDFRLFTVNSDGKLNVENYMAEFNKKVENIPEQFEASYAMGIVMETEYHQENDEVTISALTEIVICGVYSTIADVLTQTHGVYSRTEEIDTIVSKGNFEGNIGLSEEFATGEQFRKVLFFDAVACPKYLTAGEGRINAVGNVYVNVSLDSDRGIVTKHYTIPYNEEIEVSGAETGQSVLGRVSVSKSKLILNDEYDNVLRFEIGLKICGTIFDEKRYEIISDLFSTCESTDVETATVCSIKPTKGVEYSERLGGIFTTDKPQGDLRDVVTVSAGMVNPVKTTTRDGYIEAEGLLNAVVICIDYDDNIVSVEAELPFVVKLTDVSAKSGDEYCLMVNVVETSARIRRENEIELNCELRFFAYNLHTVGNVVIKDVRTAPDDITQAAAIGIYYVEKGDSLWDIAKGLKCAPEDIQTLNPNLPEVPKGGERVAVFRHLDQ